MARAPELGRVKTRLAHAIGDEAALALHRAFLADGLRAAREAGARVLLACTSAAPFPEAELADERFLQAGTDLPARLDAALAEARTRLGPGPLLVVGADTPHLSPAALRHARERLAHASAVLGPSRAGGFHLAGFAGAVPRLAAAFDGPNEAARLARLLAAQGLVPELLPPLFDVDVAGDLAELVLHLELLRAVGDPWIPAATAAAIGRLGIGVRRLPTAGEDDTRGLGLEVRPAGPGERPQAGE